MKCLLFKLNTKIILRSFIFYIFTIFILLGYVFFAVQIKIDSYICNYIFLFDGMQIMDATMYVALFCLAMYFGQKKCGMEDICFVPRAKAYGIRFISVIALSSLLLIVPVMFMIISGIVEKTSFVYILLSAVYGIIHWLIVIISAEAAGFFIGFIFKSAYAYLFSIPFAGLCTFLNEYVFSFIFKSNLENMYKFSHLFSIQSMFTNGTEIEYRGPKLDAELIIKLLLVLALFFTAFFAIKLILAKKPFYAAGTIASAAFVFIFSFIFLMLHPVRYESGEKLYVTNYQSQPYEITSVSGDISLNEWSGYNISVGITGQSAGMLSLRLDSSMDIKKLEISGSPIEFVRDGDIVTFNAPNGEFVLDISCRGRVSYVNELNSMNIYTTATSCALPPDFAFLPKIDGDRSKKQYNLFVTSLNTLVSNLDINRNGNTYTLTGNASEVCLFTGFLTQTQMGDVTIYHAKYNVDILTNDYIYTYNNAKNNKKFLFDTKMNEIIEDKWADKPKAFIISCRYGTMGFTVPYDDYVLIDFGTTTSIKRNKELIY